METDVLIIGCGYLGKRAASRWLSQGRRVAALTRSIQTAAEFESLGIQPIVGDVTDIDSLSKLPASELILYAVGFDRNAGKSMRDVYVDGLENVLTAISDTESQSSNFKSRFVYVSSTSVYGQQAGEIVDETSETNPARENGEICLDAESAAWRHAAKNAAIELNVLRLAGIYGPGRLLSRVETLKSGESLRGNPDAWLNLIHVDDAVEAVVACADRGQPNTTYLVADDRPIRRSEYYSLLAKLVDAPKPTFGEIASEPLPTLNKRCNNSKMRNQLGVRLIYPTIETGIPHAITESG